MAKKAAYLPKVHDTEVESLFVKVASNAVTQGKSHVTLGHATGVYTFTLAQAARRILGVSVGLISAGLRFEVTTANSTTVVISVFGYADTTPTDGDFFVRIDLSHSQYDR